MSVMGDRYTGIYEGHSIELVRNNWDKTLRLLIDGNEVARESRILPHDITLTGEFEHNDVRHAVTAKAVAHFPFSADSLEVDGQALPLTKVK
jgi:hypothetical protein